MSDIFISYSRKDIAFARLLHQALKEAGLETWIDWQDIPPSADWLAEVYEAIEQADSFVFIISPTSVDSEICHKEIAHAAKNNKRLIPIVLGDIEAEKVPTSLASLNWIFFQQEQPAFQAAVEDLVAAIQTDQDWVKAHTRLQNRALEWQRKDQNRSYLLRGGDLGEAERWLADAAEKDPPPTALQTQYILASRADATRRQRITMSAVLAGLVVAIGLGLLAWTQRNAALREEQQRATAESVAIVEANTRATAEAEALTAEAEALQEAQARATAEQEAVAESQARATAQIEAEQQRDEAEQQARISLSRALAVQARDQTDIHLDLAALLSAEAYQLDDNLQTRSALFTVVQASQTVSKRLLNSGMEWISSLDFSPDGRYLAVTDLRKGIQLWDLNTGQQIDHAQDLGRISCARFSPDSQHIAAKTGTQILRFQSGASGLQPETTISIPFQGVPNPGDGLAISPDGALLVAAGMDESLIFWDLASGEMLAAPLQGHGGEIESIAFSPDGRYLATSGHDDRVVLWDAINRRVLRRLAFPGPNTEEGVGFTSSHNLAFSADSSTLAAGFSDGSIHLWTVADGQARGDPLQGHRERVFSVAFSPDGRTLISGGADNQVIFWDLETMSMLHEPFKEHNDMVFAVAFGPGGKYAASAGLDARVVLWEVGAGQLPNLHQGPLLEIAFGPVENLLASSAEDGSIRFWDASTGTPAGEPITDIPENQRNLIFSPDGKLLASTGNVGGMIRYWDVAQRTQIAALASPHAGFIEAVAFSPDSAMLASGGGDGLIVLSDPRSGRVLDSYHNHSKSLLSLAFSPDGEKLLSIGLDDEIDIWNIQTGASKRVKPQTTVNPGYAMSFSHDGGLLAVSTAGPFWSEFMLFEPATGEMLYAPLSGHDDAVTVISFNPEATLVASGSLDQRVRLWDVASGQPIGEALPGHSDTIQNLVFSADGTLLASASREDPIHLWDIDPQSWLARACKIANRNLTQAEWQTFLGDLPYQKTCPAFP